MQAENGRQIRELAQTVDQLHKSNQRIEALVIKKRSSSSRPDNSGAKSGKRQTPQHVAFDVRLRRNNKQSSSSKLTINIIIIT